MRNLYAKCFDEANIREAIRIVKSHSGSKTAGPDGVTKEKLGNRAKIIKEVKARLRRYKRVNCRYVEIPKKNGKTRTLTIINLYDRIAQQCIYQVIQPILEKAMSKNSYGFRSGISAKIPVSKICSSILNLKYGHYTVEIDFTKCFDNIPLDKALNKVKAMGVNDWLLIRTIKHLMWTSKDYNGIGLSQGTILGPLLCNCYLDSMDKYIENNYELEDRKTQYSKNYQRNKGKWLEWLKKHNWPIYCKYYRYADDSIIICRDPEVRDYIYNDLSDFINRELDIEINEEKTHLGNNETIKFLGFAITKTQSISIGIADEVKNLSELKDWKFNSHEEILNFIRWLNGKLNYYDICNNLKRYISKIIDRIWWRGYRHGNGPLNKVEGHQIYEEKSNSYMGKKRKQIIIDVWNMRAQSKISYKEYITNSFWIQEREKIPTIRTWENEFTIYAWGLYTQQRGKDKITGSILNIETMVIHHITPIKQGGANSLNNLILINESTHKLIHGNEELKSKKLQWYRRKVKLNE